MTNCHLAIGPLHICQRAMWTHDRAAGYWDVRSAHPLGKQADLLVAPSPRSCAPPFQVLVHIEGCNPTCPIPTMIFNQTSDLQKMMEDLQSGNELVAKLSVMDK